VYTKSLDLLSAEIIEKRIEPATQTEIRDTVKVMGGEDWLLWVEHLADAGLLAEGVQTAAFSYIGPKVTHPFYRSGTLGRAKEHLEATSRELNSRLRSLRGKAHVSVNKAVVTRASIVIPAVPLYIAILYRIMKDRGLHEGCIEQAYRLFADYLLRQAPATDREGRIRLDDREMRTDVQRRVRKIWKRVDTLNVMRLADVKGVQEEFYRFFGFGLPAADHMDEMTEPVRRN
jgi:enoyl-[acyl-carrier protein] reductase/trans-2-enoyl-CoA reductase (NAD+)